MTVASVSQRYGGRSPVYGLAVTYRYVTSCPFAEDDADTFCPATGTFHTVQRKSFWKGGDARGRPFSKKVFPPPACPTSFQNTCYFLFENIS